MNEPGGSEIPVNKPTRKPITPSPTSSVGTALTPLGAAQRVGEAFKKVDDKLNKINQAPGKAVNKVTDKVADRAYEAATKLDEANARYLGGANPVIPTKVQIANKREGI